MKRVSRQLIFRVKNKVRSDLLCRLKYLVGGIFIRLGIKRDDRVAVLFKTRFVIPAVVPRF